MKKGCLRFLSMLLFSVSITSFAMELLEEDPNPDTERHDIGTPREKDIGVAFWDWETQSKRPFYKRHPVIAGVGATTIAAGTLAALAAAAYAGLKWWQKRQINEVLQQYDKNINMLSAQHKLLLIAAYKRNVRQIQQLASIALSPDTPWLIAAMAELYFKTAPTQNSIESLRILIKMSQSPTQ